MKKETIFEKGTSNQSKRNLVVIFLIMWRKIENINVKDDGTAEDGNPDKKPRKNIYKWIVKWKKC